MARLLAALLFAALAWSPSWAQTPAQTEPGKRAPDTERSRKASDFSHIIRERDAQIERRAEVQRVINFADAATVRLNRFFNDLPSGDFAGELDRRLQSEQSRWDRLEAAPADPATGQRGPRAPDPRATRVAAKGDMPPPPRGANGAEPTPLLSDALKRTVASFEEFDHRPMMADLHASVAELRRNLSQKHLYWAADFENLMADWERRLRKASGLGAMDALLRSQEAAGQTADASGRALPEEADPQSPLSRHRRLLQRASDTLRDRPTHDQVREKTLSDATAFADRIKKVGTDYDNDIREVENRIVRSADEIFGSDVNSSVFTYLLMAFAGIFVLIMVVPRFYAGSSVAENILKAEFLLQFSTVFILTAAIIILGIGNFIQSDQLPVLLAGISGYVLGQLGKPGADLAKNAPVLARSAEPPGASPGNDNAASDGPQQKKRAPD